MMDVMVLREYSIVILFLLLLYLKLFGINNNIIIVLIMIIYNKHSTDIIPFHYNYNL